MDHIIDELKRLTDLQDRNKERIKGALALLEAIEWIDKRVKPEPPPPTPTPDAPDPGPGWRLVKIGEVIPPDSQIHVGGGEWFTSSRVGHVAAFNDLRTPIYHNPVNLETAGEGYRFCLVSETEADATDWWDCSSLTWSTDYLRNSLAILESGCTYRTKKPLPTT